MVFFVTGIPVFESVPAPSSLYHLIIKSQLAEEDGSSAPASARSMRFYAVSIICVTWTDVCQISLKNIMPETEKVLNCSAEGYLEILFSLLDTVCEDVGTHNTLVDMFYIGGRNTAITHYRLYFYLDYALI